MKHIFLFVLVLLSTDLSAQQEPLLTRYTFNALQFNPAYAGHRGEDLGSATLQYRSQWVGIDGAPTSYFGTGERSFFNHSVGLGIGLSYEGIGANSQTEAALSSNYRLQLRKGGYLSGGLRVGFGTINTDINKLNVRDESEFGSNIDAIQIFSVGAGFLYHDETFQVGFSIPALFSKQNQNIQRVRHIYGHACILIGDEYATIKWKPALLVKYEKAVPLQITLGTQAWITKTFAPGIHWRVGESIALSFEVVIDQKFNITGAYDFTTNELNNYSNGSFELMLGYKFGE